MEQLMGRFIKGIPRTPTVESFRFIFEKKIDFVPGQFLQFTFDKENPANKELNKYLSFSCSPLREYIEVTKRISESQFSRRLLALKVDEEVLFKAPLGSCVFKEEYKKIGFLIGGIGITPVISIIEYIIDKKLDTDAILFYSNRNEAEIAFRIELDYWQLIDTNLKIYYTVTDTEHQPKDEKCIYGVINQALLEKHMIDIKGRIIFAFGPPKMVEAMKGLCLGMGCNPANVKTESFLGY
jgi:ferredoxin-NADP reductase